MRNRKLEILSVVLLTGAVGLSAACRKTETTTAAAATPAAAASEAATTTRMTTTTTTTTMTAEVAPAETAVITADPVVVSQRNATRRRAGSQLKTTSKRAGRPGYSEERPAPEARSSPAVRVVPEGTILRVAFDEPISTATAREGDTVRGKILDDVLAEDGSVVAASGSRVVGRIDHVVDSGKLARPAELTFRLTELETRGGPVPIRTSAYQRVGKTHTKRNVEYIAGGAAVGAIIGQVLGRDTESTLKGAAAGAAAGTGAAAVTGDLDFTIDAGRTVAFTLEDPIRIR
ncbi:MAG TPA: hypothetical protein VGK86_14265 [Thermoanaerobaculia bacterium]|jgi:hypothetical protein